MVEDDFGGGEGEFFFADSLIQVTGIVIHDYVQKLSVSLLGEEVVANVQKGGVLDHF